MAQFPQRLVSMAPPVAPGCAGALVLTQAAGVSVEPAGVLGGAGVEPAGIMSPMMPPPPPCTPKAARHAATSSSDNSDNSDDSDDSLPSSQAYRTPHVRSQLRRQSSAASARSMFMSPTSVHGHADTGPRWMGCQLARGALLRLVCWANCWLTVGAAGRCFLPLGRISKLPTDAVTDAPPSGSESLHPGCVVDHANACTSVWVAGRVLLLHLARACNHPHGSPACESDRCPTELVVRAREPPPGAVRWTVVARHAVGSDARQVCAVVHAGHVLAAVGCYQSAHVLRVVLPPAPRDGPAGVSTVCQPKVAERLSWTALSPAPPVEVTLCTNSGALYQWCELDGEVTAVGSVREWALPKAPVAMLRKQTPTRTQMRRFRARTMSSVDAVAPEVDIAPSSLPAIVESASLSPAHSALSSQASIATATSWDQWMQCGCTEARGKLVVLRRRAVWLVDLSRRQVTASWDLSYATPAVAKEGPKPRLQRFVDLNDAGPRRGEWLCCFDQCKRCDSERTAWWHRVALITCVCMCVRARVCVCIT